MLLKDSFLLQTRRSLRHWTLKQSQVIFDGEKFSYELDFILVLFIKF